MSRHAGTQVPAIDPEETARLELLTEIASIADQMAARTWASDSTGPEPADRSLGATSGDSRDAAPDLAALGRLADLESAASRAAAINALRYAEGLETLTPIPAESRIDLPAESPTVAPLAALVPAIDTVPWRAGWTALLLNCAARGVIAILACLLVCSVAFAALGWHPTVVMSDSMAPRLRVGDVAISRPVPASRLRVGQVVLVADPDHPNQLRLHRLASVAADGMLTLRGDANQHNDSTAVAPSAVHGVGVLRVPFIATPMYLLHIRDYRKLAALVAALAALLAIACLYRAPDDDRVGLNDDLIGTGCPGRHRLVDLKSQVAVPASHLASTHLADKHSRINPDRQAVRRLAGVAVLIGALLGVGLAIAAPAKAALRFARVDSHPASSWAAQSYFTCRAAVLADSPYVYYRLDTASSRITTDSSGNGRTGNVQGAGSVSAQPGSCVRDTSKAATVRVIAGYLTTPTRIVSPKTFTVEIWFRTTSTTGARLIGFSSSDIGSSSRYDRHVYLTPAGNLDFGVQAGAVRRTISSTARYNDGAWHLVDASLSATTGMQLYVDGVPAAADTKTTSALSYTGFWRIGYGELTNWPGVPTGNVFTGSVDDAAVYPSALSAGAVVNHNAAGR